MRTLMLVAALALGCETRLDLGPDPEGGTSSPPDVAVDAATDAPSPDAAGADAPSLDAGGADAPVDTDPERADRADGMVVVTSDVGADRPDASVDAVVALDVITMHGDTGADASSDSGTDAGEVCTPGTRRDCYSGPSATAGVGRCRRGSQNCDGARIWSTCFGEVAPTEELCGNGTDDDCDGTADEGCEVPRVVELSLGAHTCARVNNGTLSCWGLNDTGQLGNGSTTLRTTPTAVAILTNATRVAAGTTHTCALLADATLRCWGANSVGQLGNGGTTQYNTPGPVQGLAGVVEVALGFGHTCARVMDGNVFCWGTNSGGRLGDGTTTDRRSPTRARVTGATQLALGGTFTCARIANGAVQCWGWNHSGQLGDGSTAMQRATPGAVTGLAGVEQVELGDAHACARLGDGTVRCWGHNFSGQLGDGTTTNRATPVAVAGLRDVVQIAVGTPFSCARLRDGSVRCWGANNAGQLGDDSTTNRATPVAVAGLNDAVEIAAGEAHACARRAAGAIVCWGDNTSGQVGDGTTTNRRTPRPVLW